MDLKDLKDLKIKKKFLLILSVIAVTSIIIIALIGYWGLNGLENDVVDSTVSEMEKELNDALKAKEKVWLTNALQIANNPIIQESMAQGNREEAIKLLNEYSETFKSNTGFNNVNVHLIDEQLDSFVKSWDSNNFGESLSYSDAYQRVKETEKATVVTEESPKGLRLKGLYPVHYQGEFVGIVNFEGGLNSIKRTLKENNIEFLYFLNNNYLDTAAGLQDESQIGDYTLSQKDVDQKFLEEIQSDLNLTEVKKDYSLNGNYLVTSQTIKNGAGEEVGLYLLGQNKKSVMGAVTESKTIVYILYLAFVIIFGVQIFAIYSFVSKEINNPLDSLKESIDNFASGNLSQKIDLNRQDEIGQLGVQLENMRANLKNLVASILKETEELSAYSQELSASAEEGNATIETNNRLVEDMSASIQQISASAQEVASFAQESNNKTEEGTQNINKTLNSMEQINESVTEAVAAIEDLSNTSQEISSIVELITDIAEQTNLLALNAAIEAARAGDAGQGFAVVAEEIRELAEETNQATERIAHLIDETTNKVETGLDAIEKANDKVEDGQEIVEKTGAVFDEIETATQQTAQQIDQTANATQDLAAQSDKVRETTADMASMADEIANSSQELSEMAQKLQQLSNEFKV
ncbi:MAG: methyl-accepting chemotaxis protein [Bacillota bacterium]